MTQEERTVSEQDRKNLDFENAARQRFTFLNELGFSEVEALPTLLRYQKGSVEVDVYHGRRSYEIGAGVSHLGSRYAIAEIIRSVDSTAAKNYRNPIASTREGVVAGLEELRSQMHRYGSAALQGDPKFFSVLKEKQKVWAEEYWLDGLTSQLRPQADEAFRRGDYSKAAELYARIRSRLGPAELKKLTLAEERSRR
jgi:hypothetical protein